MATQIPTIPVEDATTSEIAGILHIAAPDGFVDDRHALQTARAIAKVVHRHMRISVQHQVSVGYHDGRPVEKMQALDEQDARAIADRLSEREDVVSTRTFHRYCSPWHRTS
jgi:hypothetical protein